VGIDLEFVDPDFPYEQVVGYAFSPGERAALQALPEGARREAFYRAWTRKEAYIKARGEGLSFPLHDMEVSLTPGEPVRLLWVAHDPREASRWSLRALTPDPGYIAALAVEGHRWRLACWEWEAHTERGA
jgi:4'-phosphopantetheinyl transferase